MLLKLCISAYLVIFLYSKNGQNFLDAQDLTAERAQLRHKEIVQRLHDKLSEAEAEKAMIEERARVQRLVADEAKKSYERDTGEEIVQMVNSKISSIRAEHSLEKVIQAEDILTNLDKEVYEAQIKINQLKIELIRNESELNNEKIKFISNFKNVHMPKRDTAINDFRSDEDAPNDVPWNEITRINNQKNLLKSSIIRSAPLIKNLLAMLPNNELHYYLDENPRKRNSIDSFDLFNELPEYVKELHEEINNKIKIMNITINNTPTPTTLKTITYANRIYSLLNNQKDKQKQKDQTFASLQNSEYKKKTPIPLKHCQVKKKTLASFQNGRYKLKTSSSLQDSNYRKQTPAYSLHSAKMKSQLDVVHNLLKDLRNKALQDNALNKVNKTNNIYTLNNNLFESLPNNAIQQDIYNSHLIRNRTTFNGVNLFRHLLDAKPYKRTRTIIHIDPPRLVKVHSNNDKVAERKENSLERLLKQVSILHEGINVRDVINNLKHLNDRHKRDRQHVE